MVTVTFVSQPPARDAFHKLLVDYYDTMIPMNPPEMAAQLNATAIADGFWSEVEEYLPPHGRIALAHNDEGTLVGGGMMRTIRPGVGEFKRLFVQPEGRGLGLGRKLIQIRLDAAREIGLHTIFADTLRNTHAMQTLYKDFGFVETERYPESHSAVQFPALIPELRYFRLDL